MSSKYYAFIVAIIFLTQNSQNLLADSLGLEKITENLVKVISKEKLENRESLQMLDSLISYTKKQIDTGTAVTNTTRAQLDKYKSTKHDMLFFPLKSIKLEQSLNLLNQSHLIKATENSPEIIAISNRIFLSNEGYLTDQKDKKRLSLDSPAKLTKAIQKNAAEFNLASNEAQPLGVIIGNKQNSIQSETENVKTASSSLIEFINDGGLIGSIIILSGLIVLILGLVNYRNLQKFNLVIEDPALIETALFSEFSSIETRDYSFEQKEVMLSKVLHQHSAKLRGTIDYIRFIATISPMLGLLGTVSGLVITFQSFNLSGNNDSSIVAAGISQALTTTILGLIVAVPSLLLFTLLSSRVKFIEESLEQFAFQIMLDSND